MSDNVYRPQDGMCEEKKITVCVCIIYSSYHCPINYTDSLAKIFELAQELRIACSHCQLNIVGFRF